MNFHAKPASVGFVLQGADGMNDRAAGRFFHLDGCDAPAGLEKGVVCSGLGFG